MTAEQKGHMPNVQYGEQFNQLLQLAREAVPEVDARLWPKPIAVRLSFLTGPMLEATYMEIETYVRQVLNLLPERASDAVAGVRWSRRAPCFRGSGREPKTEEDRHEAWRPAW